MKPSLDALVTFLIAWGIPTFMVIRGYLKMSDEDKKEAMSDFKSRRFIFSIGFVVLGAFLTHLSSLLTLDKLKISGLALMIAGNIYSAVTLWKTRKIRSFIVLLVLFIAIFAIAA